MNFNDIIFQITNFFQSAPIGMWPVVIFVAIAVFILFLPVFLGAARGLSGAQQLGVFIATLLGFWIIGLILAIVMRPDNNY